MKVGTKTEPLKVRGHATVARLDNAKMKRSKKTTGAQRICDALRKTLDLFNGIPKVSLLPLWRHYAFRFAIGVD